MKLRFDVIECRDGWQCECTIASSWTCYSKVYPSIDKAKAIAESLAKFLHAECVFNEDPKQEGVK